MGNRGRADIKLGIAAVDVFIAAEIDRANEMRVLIEFRREFGSTAARLDNMALDHPSEILPIVKSVADELLKRVHSLGHICLAKLEDHFFEACL